MKRIIPYRWLRILIWLLIVLAVIWSAVWYAASSWIDNRVEELTTRLKDRGTEVECANRSVSGFPFSMKLNCEKVSVVTVRGTERADAGALSTGTSVWAPDVITTRLASPFVTYAGGEKLQIDWSRLETKIDGNLQGTLDLVQALGNRIKLQRGGLIVSANSHATSLRPVSWNPKVGGDATSLDLRFSTKQFGLQADNGFSIPLADIKGAAVLENGFEDLISRPKSVQAVLADGAKVRVINLVVSLEGGGQLGFSGPIQLSANGLISGKVRMGISDPQAVAAWASQIDPNLEQAVAGLGQAVAGMGKPSKIGGKEMRTISVKIKRGEVRLGFIKLGKIPRLRLNR